MNICDIFVYFRFQHVEVGATVRIPVPNVDRAKVDHRNVMAVVMEANEGFYQLGTQNGILPHLYTRNQFEPTSSNFLSIDEIPSTSTSLRSAATSSSMFGQGYFHCNCATNCNTKRCSCLKSDRKCNSRCHNSLSCKNK